MHSQTEKATVINKENSDPVSSEGKKVPEETRSTTAKTWEVRTKRAEFIPAHSTKVAEMEVMGKPEVLKEQTVHFEEKLQSEPAIYSWEKGNCRISVTNTKVKIISWGNMNV